MTDRQAAQIPIGDVMWYRRQIEDAESAKKFLRWCIWFSYLFELKLHKYNESIAAEMSRSLGY